MTEFPLSEYLREVFPDGWNLSRFGWLFAETNERNGEEIVGEALSVSEYRGVVPRDVSAGQMTSEDVATYRVVRPGQLAANVMWLNRSGLGVSRHTGYVSPAYKVFDISPELDTKFTDYALRSTLFRAVFESMGRGVRPNSQMVETFDLRSTTFPLPPLATQRAIADFLDRETAKIDALIEKQHELIGLLKERRQAAILGAVSGSEVVGERLRVNLGWLDSIPQAWTAQPVDYLAEVTLGKMVTPVPPSAEAIWAPYLRAANVQPDGATAFDDLNEMWFLPRELVALTIKKGDVVVVEGGQGGFGRAAYVSDDLPGVGFQNSINRLRPIKSDGRFLTYSLIAIRNAGYLHAYCDTVSMPHLTAEKLSRIRLAVPPLAEQVAIADHLDRETAKIDALIAKAEQHIELARERRSALVTAAVTGQIEVPEAA